ncbi:Mig-5 [Aphelenchoides besseyi]|nr:Mig-5 [Aphelenchoides besseyi]
MSTKVYYYFEDKTPYLSTVNVPSDRITLGDFKKVFNRRGYKFFYQIFDPVIQSDAKHEILHDHERLVPNSKGLFELHLKREKKFFPPSSSICDDFDCAGGQRVSMVTADKSSVGSFISKRAGEQLADLCTSEDETSRKQRYRRPYVPSTICSASESSYSMPLLTEVKLNLSGLRFVALESGIFVGAIQPGSQGDRCKILEVGDQILQVESTSFEHLSNEHEVMITIAKHSSDRQSDTLSALCETMGVDVSLWVETTKQTPQETNFEAPPVIAQEIDETSDEERAAYEDRRNGRGAQLVPLVQQQAEKILTTSDPPIRIVRSMARPSSGLTIKDRKWLKIPIPQSFIGHELVNWLLTNVRGFENRKEARSFANRLLQLQLIKHAVQMSRFSEKCYYKFDEKISVETKNGDSPTEITFISGSQSSPRVIIPGPWPVSPILRRSPTITNDYASMIDAQPRPANF